MGILTLVSCKKTTEVPVIPQKTPTVTASSSLNLDSINTTNERKIAVSGNDINKLLVSPSDSLIWITSSKYKDHRIFGYEKPNSNSKKMLLISCFTADVENNPFALPYGAYYELQQEHKAKFLKQEKDFIVAKFILNEKDMGKVYFENKWVEFEEE